MLHNPVLVTAKSFSLKNQASAFRQSKKLLVTGGNRSSHCQDTCVVRKGVGKGSEEEFRVVSVGSQHHHRSLRQLDHECWFYVLGAILERPTQCRRRQIWILPFGRPSTRLGQAREVAAAATVFFCHCVLVATRNYQSNVGTLIRGQSVKGQSCKLVVAVGSLLQRQFKIRQTRKR
jgi:hypothetical protein